jgi:hypothetical protein
MTHKRQDLLRPCVWMLRVSVWDGGATCARCCRSAAVRRRRRRRIDGAPVVRPSESRRALSCRRAGRGHGDEITIAQTIIMVAKVNDSFVCASAEHFCVCLKIDSPPWRMCVLISHTHMYTKCLQFGPKAAPPARDGRRITCVKRRRSDFVGQSCCAGAAAAATQAEATSRRRTALVSDAPGRREVARTWCAGGRASFIKCTCWALPACECRPPHRSGRPAGRGRCWPAGEASRPSARFIDRPLTAELAEPIHRPAGRSSSWRRLLRLAGSRPETRAVKANASKHAGPPPPTARRGSF